MSKHIRATIYFSSDIFKALRLKAAATHQTMSSLVNQAVKDTFTDDAVDLDSFTLLRAEPADTFSNFVSGLRRRGTL